MATFRERFKRLHHEERHCWIGKNERSLLEVLKTGRGVGERQRARKETRAVVVASIERSPIEDTETIVRAWCATVNSARPHEERLECEAVSPNFRE